MPQYLIPGSRINPRTGKPYVYRRGPSRPKSRRIVKRARIGKSLGFPKTNTVQMRYCTSIQLADPVGGVLDLHAFSANGIYDVDITGTGHQPLGRDQWADNFYNHYKVIKSKCTIKMVNEFVGSGAPVVSGAYLSDDLSVPTAWTTLTESGRGGYNVTTPGNTEQHKLSTAYSAKQFFKGQGTNWAALGSAVGANPTDQAYYIIYAQSADESNTFVARTYIVTIDYVVQFSEPKDLQQS